MKDNAMEADAAWRRYVERGFVFRMKLAIVAGDIDEVVRLLVWKAANDEANVWGYE